MYKTIVHGCIPQTLSNNCPGGQPINWLL